MKRFTKQEVGQTGRVLVERLAETLDALGLKGAYAGAT